MYLQHHARQILVINPRRACTARVTVVVSCMCLYVSVCLSAHAILAVRAIKSITKDTIVLSVRFAAILNCFIMRSHAYYYVMS